MAFRGYELNLIMRVQDRATTRLRRLSQDLGGIGRAAEMQRDANALARRAFARNLTLEQQAARDRLLGLNNATTAANQFTASLNRSVMAGRLSAAQAQQIETAYKRVAAAERLALRSRVAIHAGSVAAMTGGLGLGVAAGTASQFATFSREATKAATQVRGVNASFLETIEISGALRSRILDLTREFPAPAAEMAQSFYDIASGMNVVIDRESKLTETAQRFNAASRLLRASNQVAVAGQVDLATATNALIGVFNNFDPQAENVNETLNDLFAIVRFGRGTFEQFAPQFGKMAAGAKAAGQSLTEAGGAVAFLSQRLTQSEAVVSLNRLLQIMSRREFLVGFESIFKVPATVGKAGNERLKQLSEIIAIIATRLPKLRAGGTNLQQLIARITGRGQDIIRGDPFGTATGLQSTEQARRGLTFLVTGVEDYMDVLENVNITQNEFTQSLAAMQQDPGVRWQVAINQLKAFAVVMGETALPAILRMVDWISNLAHRYEDLSPHTRELIGQFFTWGSAIVLVSGVLAILVGGIGSIIAKLVLMNRILGGGGAGAIGKFGMLWGILRNLAAIGAIVITLKTIWGGDPSARDFLMGAIAGGVAGSRFGPLGALGGAITVPVIMAVASKDKGPHFNAAVNEAASSSDPLVRAYAEYFKNAVKVAFRTGVKPMSPAEFRASINKFKIPAGVDAVERNRENLHNFEQQNADATLSILEKWQQLASQMTGIDLFGTMSQQVATNAVKLQLAMAKAQASGNEAALRSAINAQIKFDQAQIKNLERLPQTAERVKNLTQLYDDLAAQKAKLESLDKKDTETTKRATEAVRARQEAEKNRLDTVDKAADTLLKKYQELEQANKAAFAIFEGPIAQGPIISMFNEINSKLRSFGAEPIPIPIQFQIQDIETQAREFDRFVSNLDNLRKRGVPRELIEELRGKGVEGLPILEGLRQAAPGALRQYVKLWQQGQTTIEKTTQMQLQETLKLWNSYGKDIAFQIVQGLASDKAQATLTAGFKKYITGAFAAQLKSQFAKDVAANLAQFDEVQRTKKGSTTPKTPKPTQTRTTQSTTVNNYGGDQTTVHADGATPRAVQTALNRSSFKKRNKP